MVFYADLETRTEKKTIPTESDRGCAALLMEVLTRHKLRANCLSMKTYSQEIRKLRQKENISNEQIMCIIQWYDNNAQEEYSIKIWDGESFRYKFTKMRSAMERQRQSGPVSLDEEGKKIFSVVDNQIWRKVSRENLQRAVACSIQNLQIMKKLLDQRKKELQHRIEVMEALPPSHSVSSKKKEDKKSISDMPIFRGKNGRDLTEQIPNLIRDIRQEVLTETQHTITNHFYDFWKSVHNWDKWSGCMKSCIISPTNKTIVQAITHLCEQRFGGSSGRLAFEYIQAILKDEGYLGCV